MRPVLSICIPAYNRPHELCQLLESIGTSHHPELEIVVAEDCSPKRAEIASVVQRYAQHSPIAVTLIQNAENLGYDANIRSFADHARGEYLFFMGDDDRVRHDNLGEFINYAKAHRDCGFLLRSYEVIHESGAREPFLYSSKPIEFSPGVDAWRFHFRRGVFISGFCVRQDIVKQYNTRDLDGTLLYQLYWLSAAVLTTKSAFSPIVITTQNNAERGRPMFGSSPSERALYTPGEVTIDNSVRFVANFFKVCDVVEREFAIRLRGYLSLEMSKYSYPLLAIQRDRGLRPFLSYNRRLRKIFPINGTIYYNLYLIGLIVCGRRACDAAIIAIKRVMGSTPRL